MSCNPNNDTWRTRPRAFKPKVRTGCKTCKIRRIKCDEQKPACVKCRSTGRQCDGYDENIGRASIIQPHDHSYLRCLSPLGNLYPTWAPPQHWDSNALQFFQIRTIANLSGYFRSELWERYVLQLSVLEPSIFHATVALGSLHRWYVNGRPPNPDPSVFHHYNKAIHHLLRPMNPLAKSVVLVACYVLSSFEALYGDYNTSFKHVSSGIRLLRESSGIIQRNYLPKTARPQRSHNDDEIEDLLLVHFSRLDLQASSFHPAWTISMMEPDLISRIRSEVSISSLEEARGRLTALLLQVMDYKRGREKDANHQAADSDISRNSIGQSLSRWWDAMETWRLQKHNSSEPKERNGIMCLRILYLTGYILLTVPRGAEETLYDNLRDEFAKIVEYAFALAPAPGDDGELSYSHELGILPGLYLTGTKCRDPILRRRALVLLTSCRRREGVWDSDSAAKVVSRIISIEEKSGYVYSCRDVVEGSRVKDTWLQKPSNMDRHATLVFTRRPRPDARLEIIEERIQW
ncbi:uncharacterized protein PV06_08620 [Exophiala oligosperma]|uniref:Zn(2)-C6 fungal-type domain-containing protein n=1 Tax=Exophiala oligosperma TaxID=215243 RepID=A0A0D2BRJ2_9EURO|nr:uncharacterized protein PV06_08620 [Exophiala oligosperma]KIW40067.1 hypothetical protein PV06_08620 [Exophiala oligosperma]